MGRQYRSASSRNGTDNRRTSSRRASDGVSFSDFDNARRSTIIIVIFLVVAAVFFCRLFFLQVIVADEYSQNAAASRTANYEVTPRRGTIFDRNGKTLAISVDATTIYANPQEVTDVAGEAMQLASILGGSSAEYAELLGQSDLTFVYLKRKADVNQGKLVENLELPGIYFIEDTKREYPYGQVGGQVIGFCDVDGNGISGLELQYDEVLKGRPGKYIAERGADGVPIPGGVYVDEEAINGRDITISIDIELQAHVEFVLTETAKSVEAPSTNAILMDGGTGEIYAAASLPLFNPADTSKVEEGATTVKSLSLAFEPGSIFKPISAMAVLEEDAMHSEDSIFCPAELPADEYIITDSHERGDMTMTFRQIIARSSNVGISLVTEKIGFPTYYDKLLKYNFDSLTGIDFPGEGLGLLANIDDWSRVQAYNITFGQGISVTPLQIVRFYGSLVNDGVECTPHFLMNDPETGEKLTYGTERIIERDGAIEELIGMLKAVVEDADGTGSAAAVDGYEAAGKTGTAEIADPNGGYLEVYNLSFVGFLAHSSSKLVCFVGASDVPFERNVTSAFRDIMTYAASRYHIAAR